MRLAELVYRAVSASLEEDGPINFDDFVQAVSDDAGGDASDFPSSWRVPYALNAINLGMQRLATSRKTLLSEETATPDASFSVPFSGGKVTAVVSMAGAGDMIPYRQSKGLIRIDPKYLPTDPAKRPVLIEYRKAIPLFGEEDVRHRSLGGDNELSYAEGEVDLEDYGVTDEMCSYVIEYAIGSLMEYMSPDLSSTHVNRAEAYFSALPTVYTSYAQTNVGNAHYSGRYF